MNKKGFTMVELLAAIVILGILIGTASVAISWILDLNKKGYYSTLEKNVILAAKSYYADNRASLPKSIGYSRKITLKTLVEKKYLSEVLDYGKGDCTKSSDSYVKVTKYSNKDYLYTAYFNCPAYKTSEEDRIKDISITIDFDFDPTKIADSVANIKVTSTDQNKIASFEYSILKDGQNIYNSGNISAGYVDTLKHKVKLKKYVPGNIRVVVTAYDSYSNRKTVVKEVAIYDKSVPECGLHSPKYNSWTNAFLAKRKVTVKCMPGSVGCLKKEFSRTFQDDMEIGYITIIGNNNSERKCPVGVYIDRVDPDCGSNTGSINWTNSTRDIKVNCTDATSGCKKAVYEKKVTNTMKNTTIEIEDNAGNKKSCPVDVYVDKTLPTCGDFSGNVIDSTDTDATVTVGCSDSDSGCVNGTFSETVPASSQQVNITIRDNAGNEKICSTNIQIRVNPPSVPTADIRIGNQSGDIVSNSNQWTSNTLWWGNFRVANNGGADIQHYEYSEGCTGEKTGNLQTDYTYSRNKNTSYCIRAVNSAGSSEWSSPYYFKIDKTKPTISVKAFKRNSNGLKEGKAIAVGTVNDDGNVVIKNNAYADNVNGWLNEEYYPNGVFFEISYSDNYALAKIGKLWNSASEPLDYENYKLSNISGTSGNITTAFKGEGKRKFRLQIKDAAGNTTNLYINAFLDRTPPDYIYWLASNSDKIYTCGGATRHIYQTRFTFVDGLSQHNCANMSWNVGDTSKSVKVCAGRNRKYQTEGICRNTKGSNDSFNITISDKAGNSRSLSGKLNSGGQSAHFTTVYKNYYNVDFKKCNDITYNEKTCGF